MTFKGFREPCAQKQQTQKQQIPTTHTPSTTFTFKLSASLASKNDSRKNGSTCSQLATTSSSPDTAPTPPPSPRFARAAALAGRYSQQSVYNTAAVSLPR
jgi:hypothetical protein